MNYQNERSIFAISDIKIFNTSDTNRNIQTFSEPSFYSLCFYVAIQTGSDFSIYSKNCDK